MFPVFLVHASGLRCRVDVDGCLRCRTNPPSAACDAAMESSGVRDPGGAERASGAATPDGSQGPAAAADGGTTAKPECAGGRAAGPGVSPLSPMADAGGICEYV